MPDGTAQMALCDSFYGYPLLAERSCENIYGNDDNVLMMSRGSVLLHGLTHCRFLDAKSSWFVDTIENDSNLNIDADIQYGPFECGKLGERRRSAANADSYM